VPAARHLTRDCLRSAGAAELAEAAELLVAELVTNSLLHAGAGTIDLAVTCEQDGVLIEVSDASPVLPRMRTYSTTGGTGRGMRLVSSIAAGYGAHDRPGGGKTVWVRLDAASARRTDEETAASFAGVDWLELA
jgi:anti-sigma regulatory factor (Ser/Thr protein kinase)